MSPFSQEACVGVTKHMWGTQISSMYNPRDPSGEIPSTQADWCSTTKLLKVTRDSQLCYGKPRSEPTRKPCLTVWAWGVQGGKRGTRRITVATECEGASVPAVKVLEWGSVTDRVAPGWSDRKISLTVLFNALNVFNCLITRILNAYDIHCDSEPFQSRKFPQWKAESSLSSTLS